MSKDLRAIVSRIQELPTLPQVVTTLLALMDDPESSAEDVNRVLERDPALVGKILKLVNSAFYGLTNKVASVRQAVVILGFNTVRSLAISAAVFDLFGKGRNPLFSRVAFWTHSIGVAAVSRVLARGESGIDPETAFVAGLLHDLGKLVLDRYAAEEFAQILEAAKEREETFHAVESEMLETDHAEIGAWLAEQWRLPGELRGAIGHHHQLAGAEDQVARLAAIVSFADFVCHRKEIGSSGNYALPVLDPASWALLSLEKSQLGAVIESVESELAKTETFIRAAVGG